MGISMAERYLFSISAMRRLPIRKKDSPAECGESGGNGASVQNEGLPGARSSSGELRSSFVGAVKFPVLTVNFADAQLQGRRAIAPMR